MEITIAINKAVEILKKNSIAFPFLEARLLMANIMKIPTSEIILNHQKHFLDQVQQKDFFDCIALRSKKIPLAYLLKNREFFGLNFFVDSRVLDPRPDSEALIELIIENYNDDNALKICEVGCGSGCLIISLLHYFKNWHGYALDISQDAINVAKKNSENYFFQTRINFLKSNIFSALKNEDKFDLIISNPPYIPTAMIDNLQDEVRLYEPRIALDGGEDGLDFYRIIAKDGRKFLNKSGKIFVEIGFNQFEEVKKIFVQNNFMFKNVRHDLNGIARALEFQVLESE